jgi:hypothetical protein
MQQAGSSVEVDRQEGARDALDWLGRLGKALVEGLVGERGPASAAVERRRRLAVG